VAEEAALELADRACRAAAAEADEADAIAEIERSGLVRFAASAVHQPTLIEDAVVWLRVVRDGRWGTVQTNRVDDEGLRAAARRAAAAAAAAPVDPHFPGLPPPAPVPAIEGYDEATAALAPEDQADRAWSAIGAVDAALYGYFTSGVTELAVASTKGVGVSQRFTDATVLTLAADEESSGYAETSSWCAGDLDPAAVAREAAETAARTRGTTTIDPGRLRAVLGPYAFSELLWYFGFSSLGALALLEGHSYLAGRLGERLFHPSFTLLDDGLDPAGYPKAFDFEGVPKRPVILVREGIATDVVWDRRTAAMAGDGHESTGHALQPAAQSAGPLPLNLRVEPGDAALDDLAGLVGDGIYVTRLHYLNLVDPREGLITGMTRDGTFLVEGGRITRPLVNLRFTTSFPELVRDLLGLGREAVLVNRSDFYEERYPLGTVNPGVATASFTVVGTGSGPGL
jgi:PmbA protein